MRTSRWILFFREIFKNGAFRKKNSKMVPPISKMVLLEKSTIFEILRKFKIRKYKIHRIRHAVGTLFGRWYILLILLRNILGENLLHISISNGSNGWSVTKIFKKTFDFWGSFIPGHFSSFLPSRDHFWKKWSKKYHFWNGKKRMYHFWNFST